MGNDYFASKLLEKLEVSDPIHAAYEAQAVSRDVGFDFANFQDVVPRALDEIRETKEASHETGDEGHEHFGDELADIMFSLTNLARHANIKELPPMDEIVENSSRIDISKGDTVHRVTAIGEQISAVAEIERSGSEKEFGEEMNRLFNEGMSDVAAIAHANGFDAAQLLRENVRKYLVRCHAIEQLAEEDGKQWTDLSANGEIIDYWKKAKILLK